MQGKVSVVSKTLARPVMSEQDEMCNVHLPGLFPTGHSCFDKRLEGWKTAERSVVS